MMCIKPNKIKMLKLKETTRQLIHNKCDIEQNGIANEKNEYQNNKNLDELISRYPNIFNNEKSD